MRSCHTSSYAASSAGSSHSAKCADDGNATRDEDRSACDDRIDRAKRVLRDACGDDGRREGTICREELGIARGAAAFDGDDRAKRWHRRFGPLTDDEVSELGLTRDVPVHGGVAHAERSRDVDDGRLLRAESSHDFLRRCENALAT